MTEERESLGEWQYSANCLGVDPQVMHPGRLESSAPAKAICAECVVVEACLDYALEQNQEKGVWGGLTEGERKHLLFRQKVSSFVRKLMPFQYPF